MEQMERFHNRSKGASRWVGAKKRKKRQVALDKRVRLHPGVHPGACGPSPQTGTFGTKQGGEKAAPRTGTTGEEGEKPWDGSSMAGGEGGTGKAKAARDTRQGWIGRRMQGSKPQGRGVWESRQEGPSWGIQNGAEGHKGGPPDCNILGQQGHIPGSSGAENEGGADMMPTPEQGSGALGWSTWR